MKTLALDNDKAEILERLRTLRPDSARNWGRMSVHQMVCHLSDAFRMGSGGRVVGNIGGPLQRTVIKWVALYLPMRWPPGINTVPELDQACGGTNPRDFAADLAELEMLLEHFVSPRGTGEWPVHPSGWRLSKGDWLRWGDLHVDHHLRQFNS